MSNLDIHPTPVYSIDNMKTQEELIISLERQKKRLNKERAIEEARKALQLEIKDKKLEIEKDKVDKLASHRELLDNEFREAIKLAAEKRVDASYRDLIDALDKTKKHINIIDGVGNEGEVRTLFLPIEIFNKYNKTIEGEVITTQQLQQ